MINGNDILHEEITSKFKVDSLCMDLEEFTFDCNAQNTSAATKEESLASYNQLASWEVKMEVGADCDDVPVFCGSLLTEFNQE